MSETTTTDQSKRAGFDFTVHRTVQEMRKDGIWTCLGDRFGGLLVRLRPFYEQAVVVKKEASETAIRMQLGLSDDETLPGDKALLVNRDAVTMAITGCKGMIRGDDELLAVARKHGWKVDEQGWVELTGNENPEQVREAFGVMMAASMQMLQTLVQASRGLHKVRDEEVSRLGESFVYGLHVKADWAD